MISLLTLQKGSLVNQFRPCVMHRIVWERYIVAGSPTTPREILAQLASDVSVRVRKHVAENLNTPIGTLVSMALDDDAEVRSTVADNPNTPLPVLELLSEDEHNDVRFGLAENPKTPIHILRTLGRDDNPYVACRARKTLETMCRAGLELAACA